MRMGYNYEIINAGGGGGITNYLGVVCCTCCRNNKTRSDHRGENLPTPKP